MRVSFEKGEKYVETIFPLGLEGEDIDFLLRRIVRAKKADDYFQIGKEASWIWYQRRVLGEIEKSTEHLLVEWPQSKSRLVVKLRRRRRR
jgi:hypothetical protein